MNDKQAAYRAAHREERRAYFKAHYKAHLEERRAYARAYRRTHRKEGKAYRMAHREELRTYHTACRGIEMIIIAQRWGDDIPRCRSDLTPELSAVPCAGALQVDHINGGGRKEGAAGTRTRHVINGTRPLDDLRLLCEQHQASYSVLHGDSSGGSRLEDWEE